MLRPKAIRVKPLKDYMVEVKFDNDEVKLFDVKPYIKGEWFSQLKDMNKFNTVHIAGLSVEWEDGQDICPDRLYYDSELTAK